MSPNKYNVTVSFKVPDELKYTIQFYLAQHVLNKLGYAPASNAVLNEGLKLVNVSWANVEELSVDSMRRCITELAEVFLLKELKIDEQLLAPVPPPDAPVTSVSTENIM